MVGVVVDSALVRTDVTHLTSCGWRHLCIVVPRMAKIVLVCYRTAASAAAADGVIRMRRFLASLCPDNLSPVEPVIAADGGGLILGVFNPADPAAVHDCSAYSGWLEDGEEAWWRPGAPAPSGSYALLRANATTVEAVADFAASRTIWIAQTDELFIASTSQRAIPYFLGSFEPNPVAQAWMLSAGTLGPSAGWDRRARPLGPDGTTRLDRARWRLTVREPPVQFRVDPSPDEVHAVRLREVLQATLGDLRLDYRRWILPLSGGFDSRAILLMMKERRGLRTVTWGRREAPGQRGNDAFIAPRVAAAMGVEHRFYETDLSDEPVERLLDRYLVAGDGRTDGIFAYLDGFRIWRSFFESGVRGVIRGDHGFGPKSRESVPADHARILHLNHMTRWCDHPGAPMLAQFGLQHLENQPLPESFSPLVGESPAIWRDRLYHLYRIPVYLAGQHDLKASYVEIADPLLVKRILDLARSHPEHLRVGKKAFLDVVAPHDVPIPYAVDSALDTRRNLMARPAFTEMLCDELASRRLRNAFTGRFADYLLASFSGVPAASLSRRLLARSRQSLRLLFPVAVRSRLRRKREVRVWDPRWVALRACIASHMLERLAIDARIGDSHAAATASAGSIAMQS